MLRPKRHYLQSRLCVWSFLNCARSSADLNFSSSCWSWEERCEALPVADKLGVWWSVVWPVNFGFCLCLHKAELGRVARSSSHAVSLLQPGRERRRGERVHRQRDRGSSHRYRPPVQALQCHQLQLLADGQPGLHRQRQREQLDGRRASPGGVRELPTGAGDEHHQQWEPGGGRLCPQRRAEQRHPQLPGAVRHPPDSCPGHGTESRRSGSEKLSGAQKE